MHDLEEHIDVETPKMIRHRYEDCRKLMDNIKRLHWRRNYELMAPTILLSEGKTFGEQAL